MQRIVLFAALVLMAESTAHAYIDPGTGSLFLQALVGGVAAVLLLARRYWHAVTGRFTRPPADKDPQPRAR